MKSSLLRLLPVVPAGHLSRQPSAAREGQVLGALCLLNYQPRTFHPLEVGVLAQLATLVLSLLDLRLLLLQQPMGELAALTGHLWSYPVFDPATENASRSRPLGRAGGQWDILSLSARPLQRGAAPAPRPD